jgi:hypothetical protein
VVKSEDLQGTEAGEVDTWDVFLDPEVWLKAKTMVEELRSDFAKAAEGISMLEGEAAQKVSTGYNMNIACVRH